MIIINIPLKREDINKASIGELLLLSGNIHTGRDAALPKLVYILQSEIHLERFLDLSGSVIFHTAVSPAGIGPTSSNKHDIESTIPELSKAGVRIHIGKGRLKQETIDALYKYNSIYAIVPPVSALLTSKIISKELVAFPEEGMEAMYKLEVVDFPVIVAVANGQSIWDES